MVELARDGAWAAPISMLAAWQVVVVEEFGGLRRGPSGELSSDFVYCAMDSLPVRDDACSLIHKVG